jgi:hypothetical protein
MAILGQGEKLGGPKEARGLWDLSSGINQARCDFEKIMRPRMGFWEGEL